MPNTSDSGRLARHCMGCARLGASPIGAICGQLHTSNRDLVSFHAIAAQPHAGRGRKNENFSAHGLAPPPHTPRFSITSLIDNRLRRGARSSASFPQALPLAVWLGWISRQQMCWMDGWMDPPLGGGCLAGVVPSAEPLACRRGAGRVGAGERWCLCMYCGSWPGEDDGEDVR